MKLKQLTFNNHTMNYKQKIISALFMLLTTFMTSLPNIQAETITDNNNNNTYRTVTIGNQIWMQDNLNIAKYRNGDIIRQVKTNEE